jgi:hypothetical protein
VLYVGQSSPSSDTGQVGVVCTGEQAEGVCHVVIPPLAVLAQEWRLCEVVLCWGDCSCWVPGRPAQSAKTPERKAESRAGRLVTWSTTVCSHPSTPFMGRGDVWMDAPPHPQPQAGGWGKGGVQGRGLRTTMLAGD